MLWGFVVRHCAAAGQEPEAGLTGEGIRSADELADLLQGEGIDAIVSSPYRRARESVEPLAARLGLPVSIDDRLIEHRLSPEPVDEWREYVRRAFSEPHLRAPNGESSAETLERARAALSAVVEGGYRRPLIATHGLLLSLLLHSLDPSFGYTGWEQMGNPEAYALFGRFPELRFQLWGA